MANVVNLGIKELRSLVRDPGMLVLILYAFTFAIYAAATAMPETLNRAPISIVDEDRSALSQQIINAFYPPHFGLPNLITSSEMDVRMDSGLDTFALDIPPHFQRDVLAGHRPQIQLNVDATRMSQAFTGTAYIHTIITQEVDAFVSRHRSIKEPPVRLMLRARFNPTLNASWFGSVMELINNVTLLAIVLTGAALIREREHGTIEHLLVMPITPLEIIASKIWSMALVVLVTCAVSLVIVVHGLLSVPVRGSLALFLVGVALDLFAATAMGILLGAIGRSMPQFGMLLILVLLPLEMLSGATTPRESMPIIVQHLMQIAPNTHFVILAQAILFRGAGISIVWPQFGAIAAIGAILFGLALAQFRHKMASMT
jgi:ABC-2 type transport system permease protein